jgi:hypothetical protein
MSVQNFNGKSYTADIITVNNTLTTQTLVNNSQANLKGNIKGINKVKAKAIPFKEYTFNSDSGGRKRYGVVAEDIEIDYPELVHIGSNGVKGVNYIDLLVKRVAELEKELADIELTPGATGGRGSTGAAGPKGNAGGSGAKGSTGAAGTNGSRGSTGSTGPKGSTGSVGGVGAKGNPGTNGSTGAKGTTGNAGTNGAVGSAGAKGSAGSKGSTGSQGIPGPKGSTGSKGNTGASGAAGKNGKNAPRIQLQIDGGRTEETGITNIVADSRSGTAVFSFENGNSITVALAEPPPRR